MLPTTGSTITAAIALAMRAERLFQRLERIVGQGDRGIGECLRHALRVGDPQRRQARPGLHQQRIHVAVIAAFELHDQVAPGEAARHADRRHRRLGARIHQPHHFDRGHRVA